MRDSRVIREKRNFHEADFRKVIILMKKVRFASLGSTLRKFFMEVNFYKIQFRIIIISLIFRFKLLLTKCFGKTRIDFCHREL